MKITFNSALALTTLYYTLGASLPTSSDSTLTARDELEIFSIDINSAEFQEQLSIWEVEDTRGTAEPDTHILADDDDIDSILTEIENPEFTTEIVVTPEVDDNGNENSTDPINGLAKRQSIQSTTDRLLFNVPLGTFLAAKKANNPKTLIWDDDGCSASPDRPLGFNFLHSCQRHDFGYRNYKKQNRFTAANRKRIDDNFKRDLDGVCGREKGLKKATCNGLANTYYTVVRAAGGL